jgi:hypothetical protein
MVTFGGWKAAVPSGESDSPASDGLSSLTPSTVERAPNQSAVSQALMGA